jgi:uncharacterized membrane-anchored protein YitT (DUF2179 family)
LLNAIIKIISSFLLKINPKWLYFSATMMILTLVSMAVVGKLMDVFILKQFHLLEWEALVHILM